MIRNLWETNHIPGKNVYLVIDSSQFTTKVVDVSALKPRQLMEYISRELTDVERISNPVYGYFPLSGGERKKEKLKQVFASVAPRELVHGYVECFAGLDLAISGVENAVGVTMRLAEKLLQLSDATCIVQFADDMPLINLLLVNGEYKYSSRNRMFSESGTPEFAAETARTVSALLQFAKAQDLAQKIPQVYIAGLSEDELQIYQDSIYQIDAEMEAVALQLEPVVKLGKAASQELTQDVVAACEEYDRLNEELQAASSLGNSMASLKSSVLAYPRVDSATEEIVASCASGLVTAEISSYDAENGLLSFDAKAGNVDDCAANEPRMRITDFTLDIKRV